MEKIGFDSYCPHKKIKSRWLVNLNVKSKTIQLLYSNIGENLCDLGVGTYFLKRQHKNIVIFLSFSFKLRTSVYQKTPFKRLTMHTIKILKYIYPAKTHI